MDIANKLMPEKSFQNNRSIHVEITTLLQFTFRSQFAIFDQNNYLLQQKRIQDYKKCS